MEKTVFPLSRYWYDSGFRFYHAYGNTPPQDYLLNCVGERKPEILVLGCGDIQSCFYSLWKHFDPNCPSKFDGVRFVLNDISAGVTARNVLFLYLCLQMPGNEQDVKKWLSRVWAIWYCHELHPGHKKLLHDSLHSLCKFSASWNSKENPLYPMVKFCSSATLDEVKKVWKMWLEFDISALSVAQMHLSRQKEFVLHGRIYHSDNSVSKYVDASLEIPYRHGESKDYQARKSEVHSYVATGSAYAETVLDLEVPPKESDVYVNATLYERADGRYSLHYALIPYSCYFQVVEFTTKNLLALNPNSETKLLVKDSHFESLPFLSNSIQQFSLWLQASRRVICKCVSFEFDCSDGLSFCLDAQNHKMNYSFNLIYTSNLIDHLCPPNLILSGIPLLKDSGVVITASLTKKVFTTFGEYLVSSFGFCCKLLPVILGIRCINYEGEEYTSPVTIQPRPLNLQTGNFGHNKKLILWEKVSSSAVPLLFPSGSELSPVICGALADCIRVSAYPLLVSTKMPLMLNNLCVETAVKVLQVFMSNTCAEYTPSFWKPLSDKLCTTVNPYLHSLQTQLLLHGIHMHLTVAEGSCPLCLHVPISNSIGLFHTRISLLADIQMSNFLVFLHKGSRDAIEYLHCEALKGNDVHAFDCVTPSMGCSILDLYFYAPLQLSAEGYKVTLVMSSISQSENTLSGMSQAPTAPLSLWQVPYYTSFIFSQAVPRSRTFILENFGTIVSHTSDGDKSEIVVDMCDRFVESFSVAKLQTGKVSSNELRLSCGSISCCIEVPYPFDYDRIHIKVMKKERKLSLVCPRGCQQFLNEKPLFVWSPEKELSLFPNVFFGEAVACFSGQQVTKKERILIESCKKGLSKRTPLIKVKECLVSFFNHPEQDFFNFLVPTTGLHGLVLVNNRFLDYENRIPVIDLAFCFLEESFATTVVSTWKYISSSDMLDMCNIRVDGDECECLKGVFNYFAEQTNGKCKSSNPSSNVNLLVEGDIHKYFTRAVISFLLCDPEHYLTQVVKEVLEPTMKTPREEENLSKCLQTKQGEGCDACGSSDKDMLFCSKCRSAKYCSKGCQRDHWKVHKTLCKQKAEAVSQVKSETLQLLEGMPGTKSQVEIPPSKPVVDVPPLYSRSQSGTPSLQPLQEVPKAQLQVEKPFDVLKKEMPVIEYEEHFCPFPVLRYCYDEDSRVYHAYGNTPVEDYLQNAIGVKKPFVLLLACGDISSCFYTLWKNFDSSISTKRFSGVSFVMNDPSSAILARNILFLYLMVCLPKREREHERKKWLCIMWAIWYCHELHTQHQKVLNESLEVLNESLVALLRYSVSLCKWESPDNPLRSLVNFSSPTTLSNISKVWRGWCELKDAISVHQMQDSRSKLLEGGTGHLFPVECAGELLTRVWTCVSGDSLDEMKQKIGSRPREVIDYIYNGNCFAESVLNISRLGSTAVNPTLYERTDGVYTQDDASVPFSCYHHMVEFSPGKLNSSGVEKSLCDTLLVQDAAFVKQPLLANCVQQFCMWAETAADVLNRREFEVHFMYDNSQPLSFCQQLQEKGIKVCGRPKLFDVIYTSNLVDHVSLSGLVLSAMPLLIPCGSLITKTLNYKSCADTIDDFLEECFGFDCKLLPVILGIRCINNEGNGFSSPVMLQPVPSPALRFETTEQCCRVLVWNKVLAQPLVMAQLPDMKPGNITEALFDSIIQSAFSLLNKSCSCLRCLMSHQCLQTAIVLLQSFDLSVASPCLDSYEFWEPLAVGLRDWIPTFLSGFQTQLLLHQVHMHLTVTKDDCPLCKQVSVLGLSVGLFRVEVTLPIQEMEPMFMALLHQHESFDSEHLCREARFDGDVHVFDCFYGTVCGQVLQLNFFAPVQFVKEDYKVTVLSKSLDGGITVVGNTSLKDLVVECSGQYDFVCSLPSLNLNPEVSCFGELTSHVYDEDEVHAEIALSASTFKALTTRKLCVTKIASNQVKFACAPHQFVLKCRYPVGDKFSYKVVKAQRIVTFSGRRGPHQFCGENPIFVTNPDHQLSFPAQVLGDAMVLVHCTMQYTPDDVHIREESVNDRRLMPSLLNFKDLWLSFFRDRNEISFFLESHDSKPLGLALINNSLFDCEHQVPALDMAFCFFEDSDIRSLKEALSSMTDCSTVNFGPEEYKLLKEVVRFLGKRTNGDCRSAGCSSRYSTLCRHNVDIYFTRVVAYPLYSDPDLKGLAAVENHLATCNNRTKIDVDLSSFPVQTKRCHFCGRYSSESKECRCRKVEYCSSRCQTKHWPQHCRNCVADGEPGGGETAAAGTGSGHSASEGEQTVVAERISSDNSTSVATAKGTAKSAVGERRAKCYYCGNASGKLKKCMRCWEALYCDRVCQVTHWPVHRLECRKRPPKSPSVKMVSPSVTKENSSVSVMEELHSSCSAVEDESSVAESKESHSVGKKRSCSSDSAGKDVKEAESHSAGKKRSCSSHPPEEVKAKPCSAGKKAKKSSRPAAVARNQSAAATGESHSSAKEPSRFASVKEKMSAAFGFNVLDFVELQHEGCWCCNDRTAPLHTCRSCGFAKYCSKECKKNHWKEHENMCLAMGTEFH